MLETKTLISMSRKIINTNTLRRFNYNLQKHHLFNKLIQNCYSTSNNVLSPENVLSRSNKEKCIALLNSIKPITINDDKIKKAAVLVPLCEIDNEIALLYIVRARHLKVNGGDVAFPGGMLDNSDGSLEATALRETFEEIGITPKDVEVWGKGPEINRRDVCVTPILGYIGRINVDSLKINTDEVSCAFPMSLERLSTKENFRITRFRFRKNYIFSTPVYLGGKKRIWGLTAYITHLMLSCLIPEYYKKNIYYVDSIQRNVFFKRKK